MTAGRTPEDSTVIPAQSVLDGHRSSANRQDRQLQQALGQIEEALAGLRFGQVTVTVHDGTIVQIDRLERTRLQRSGE